MANISITTKCNKRCGYCFANQNDQFMEGHTFERILDFLERSQINEVRLLGGEPTLHPEFSAMVIQALTRGFKVFIFTNGYMPETALKLLEKLPEEKVSILVNVVNDIENFDGLEKRQERLFQRLNSKLIPGFTIDSPSFQLDFLLDLVLHYNTARKIRLGLAHPIAEGNNQFLHPRYYPVAGRKIGEFLNKIKPYGIQISYDCGFVPCMFQEQHLATLGPELADLGNRCNPILDILPAGEVISCFPLADLQQESISEEITDTGLRNLFSEKQNPYRNMKLYKKCHSCEFTTRGYCVGGCLSASMQRQRAHEFAFALPDI